MSDDLVTRMKRLRDETVWPHDDSAWPEWCAHIVEVEALQSKLQSLQKEFDEADAEVLKLQFVNEELARTQRKLDQALAQVRTLEKVSQDEHGRAYELQTRLNAALLALLSIRNTPPAELEKVEYKNEHWWYRLVADMRDQAAEAFEAGKAGVVERQNLFANGLPEPERCLGHIDATTQCMRLAGHEGDCEP